MSKQKNGRAVARETFTEPAKPSTKQKIVFAVIALSLATIVVAMFMWISPVR